MKSKSTTLHIVFCFQILDHLTKFGNFPLLIMFLLVISVSMASQVMLFLYNFIWNCQRVKKYVGNTFANKDNNGRNCWMVSMFHEIFWILIFFKFKLLSMYASVSHCEIKMILTLIDVCRLFSWKFSYVKYTMSPEQKPKDLEFNSLNIRKNCCVHLWNNVIAIHVDRLSVTLRKTTNNTNESRAKKSICWFF